MQINKLLVATCLVSASAWAANSAPACNEEPPREVFYTGNYAPALPKSFNNERKLLVVSYNVNFFDNYTAVVKDLKNFSQAKRVPDVILLQEAVGSLDGLSNQVDKLAEELRYNYVYAPSAALRGGSYGNAILSRWPMENFTRLLLPLSPSENCNQRSAVLATLQLPQQYRVTFSSLHLSTRFPDTIGREQSRALQLLPLLELLQYTLNPVFMAGDMNTVNGYGTRTVKENFAKFKYLNAHSEPKVKTFRRLGFHLDRAYLKGNLETTSFGVDYTSQGSDHYLIWSDILY